MTRKTIDRNVSVPAGNYPVGTFGGETVYMDFAAIPDEVMTEIITNGALRVLRDGVGGKDTDADKIAALHKRLDAWYRGDWAVANRGNSQETLMRDAYRAELESQIGKPLTDADWAKWQAQQVKEATGKKHEKGVVKFDTLLHCRAKIIAKRDGGDAAAIEAALIAKFEEAGRKLGIERAAASKALDTADLSF